MKRIKDNEVIINNACNESYICSVRYYSRKTLDPISHGYRNSTVYITTMRYIILTY